MRRHQVSMVAALCVALSLSAFAGSARVNQLPPTTFDQIAKLTAPDGEANDQFGYSVGIDGSTIVVGKADSALNTAFVYENNAGTVTQVAELTPSDGLAGDRFGYSVAISGNTIVVSSRNHKNFKPINYGSVYVYVEPAGGWSNMTETAELNLGQANAGVGNSIGVSGSTVVSTGGNADGVVVWVAPSGGWVSSSKPNAELINTNEAALASVAISGDVIVAGAPQAYSYYGAVFLYEKPASGWNKIGITETARLVGNAVGGGGGNGVAIDGNTVVTAGNTGPINGAYVYVKPAGGWVDMNQNAFLSYQGAFSVAVSGGTVVVGNPYQLVGVNPQQGAAYVFEKPAGGWKNTSTYNAELTASDGNLNDQFSTGLGVSGGTVVAGSPLAEIGSNAEQGAAYVFAQQ
jgi:hypothetical protein